MKTSKFKVENRTISYLEDVPIVGNVNVDTFSFEFDSEWEGFNKTLTIVTNGNTYLVNLINDECILPQAVYDNETISIGIYGVKDNAVLSTSIIYISLENSTYGQIEEITNLPDIDTWNLYTQQMLALLAQATNTKADCEAIRTALEALQREVNTTAQGVAADAETVESLKTEIETAIRNANLQIAEYDANATEKTNEFNRNATTWQSTINAAGNRNVGNVEAEGTRQTGLVTAEGTTQKGNVTAEGTRQVGVVAAAGTDAVSDVNTAKDNAVGAVGDAEGTAVEHIESLDPLLIGEADFEALATKENRPYIVTVEVDKNE